MRIALVIERFLPSGGGVEGVAWQVAHGLAAAGEDVHVFAREHAATSALAVHALSVSRTWQPLRVLRFDRASRAAIARARPFDVVHSFSRTSVQDVFRAGGGSHADYMRRAYSRTGAGFRRLSPRHQVLLEMERRAFADPSQLVQCPSQMVRDEIRRRHGVPEPRLRVIPNGVDIERFAPAANRLRAAGPTRWLFVGSGFQRKGLDVALEALAASTDRDARLRVVGADAIAPWRSRTEALGLAERVEFLGRRDDLPALYAEADALLLPSRYDAFANVTLEAAAAGLPIVTTATNGASEVVAEAAIVVPEADDVAALRAAIDALADPEERARRGERARAIAALHAWPRHIEALRRLYLDVVSRRSQATGLTRAAS